MDDQKLIQDLFIERFKAYNHTFESSDAKLAKMPKEELEGYYLRAKDLITHPVLKQEVVEWKRKLYTELALKSFSDLERQGYRMTLLAIQDFEVRLKTLSDRWSEKPLQSLADKL